MFPIGWMYYFGTNLENRFSVPGFWPAPETTNKIPYEKKEQVLLLEEMKKERLERRRRRLEAELAGGEKADEGANVEAGVPRQEMAVREGGGHGFAGLEDMKQEQLERRKRKLEAELEEMGKGA